MSALPTAPMGCKPVAAPPIRSATRPKGSNAEVALRLAAAGLHVFPCCDLKRPLGGIRWRDESTTDSEKVAPWWRRWPDALIGLDCGKSGLLVIDADRHPGGSDDDVDGLSSTAS